jgi:N-acetyl-anhydromuramyl-L-alanine amidase AmpD
MSTSFIPAHANRFKNLEGQPARPWHLVVIHDMEAPEATKTALNVAQWFYREATPQTSAHYCIDAAEVIQCVQLRDVAYAAPNANRNGIHLELAGYAKQSAGDWHDPYSLNVLANAAELLATIILPKTHIPLQFVDAAGLAAGKHGITTHAEVSKWSAAHGLPGDHSHTDPGPNFPMAEFIEMVRERTAA